MEKLFRDPNEVQACLSVDFQKTLFWRLIVALKFIKLIAKHVSSFVVP